MARMIPAAIDPDTPSLGEKDVYRRLAEDPIATAWTVVHSLDLPHHVRRISGELDFVILIPGSGILCLEIKAAANISRHDGLWYYGQDPKGDPRGPFRQASEGMHSLRERLVRRYPPVGKAVFWSGVILPYTSLDLRPEEWHPWQLIDATRYRSASLAQSCKHLLARAREFLATRPSASWFDPASPVPDEADCDTIVRILRPDFEAYQSPRERRRQVNAELKRYTQEQFGALDAMTHNPRVIFEGPAGTGKTLLAIESAQRAAADGKRTLLVCFNRHLGHWLRSETEGLGDLVVAGTLHAHMLTLAGLDRPSRTDAAFWQDELPTLALEHLLGAEGASSFHLVIVDEAQDLLGERYLDILDLSLLGGLSSGQWRFFGDFERQSIYSVESSLIENFRARRGVAAPLYSLRTNCRNTPRVATLVRLLGHLEPDYASVRRPDDGIEPELRFHADHEDAPGALVRALSELRGEGYKGSDIVVLSGRASGSAADRVTEQPWCDRLRPLGGVANGHTLHSTIHAFKGLEAPAVVVTDLDDFDGPQAEALLYIAVTRPTERLVLLMHESARASLARAMAGALAEREARNA